ncbi:conserved Plasmodium protein, unknown function [Plasmodium ovale wallikeri]|uniref:Uncharacterized protein n=2 Tax=Plasmodium ovale TaxID=36330 RepID=A0A1A8ZFH9_PLAOA|nr:conserved Plasmodium protein, unknown function [Plasmodium ovale wallikeri]SBT42839.1 conserved Plasmodium protein, unknown function [Plasmodium ovale wallikeri]SBT78359.1 conserved Plasmodium protein, unknown function [Plasmodium ovale]
MNSNNEENKSGTRIIKKDNILGEGEEMGTPINRKKDEKGGQEKSKVENIREDKLLIFNKYLQKELGDKKEGRNDDVAKEGKKEKVENFRKDKNFPPKEENNKNPNNEEFEIPIHRGKRNTRNDFLSDNFFKNREYEQEKEDNKKLHILDIFNYHDFPINLFGKKKTKAKSREKKFVIEFIDSYNDDFVKKNINKNLIFESIGICKGISFLHINKNINVSCLGAHDNNAFYFYKMIPFDKIYTKDAINKIVNSKNNALKREKANTHDKGPNVNSNCYSRGICERNGASSSTRGEENPILKNYHAVKNYLFKEKKDKKTLYNDLYLSPYEKNLKSSVCIGTHIYSKERAVKKCFGLLIEQNVYSLDLPQDENNTVNKNLENLYFDFPYYKNQIIFKPIFYPYKNIPIVNNSFQNWLKNIPWEKVNNFRDMQFYYGIKNNIFHFSKDIYLTTKGAIKHFDSPKDFIIQTANRMNAINIQMMKICERSYYLLHDYVLKLSKVPKSS